MTQTASSTDPKVLVQRLLAPIADDMKAVDDYIRAELASDVSRMHQRIHHQRRRKAHASCAPYSHQPSAGV